DVRAERVDLPLLAVERQDVVAAAAIGPEPLVEGAAQLLGLALEPVGERPVAPDFARKLGGATPGVVDVALHLARRDRALGDRAVVEALRVAGVLPRLVFESTLGSPFVLDETVAVAVGVLVEPRKRL